MRIEAIWKELTNAKDLPAFRRIDDQHPLDIYGGIDEDHSLLLAIVTKRVPPEMGKFQSLSIRRFHRDDSHWLFTITLEDSKLSPLFALLCEDLASTTAKMNSEAGPTQFFARLNRWKALLASGSIGLSEPEVRGLIAELHILTAILAPHFGLAACVLGWAGPEAEEQDFRIENRSFEVKAVSTGKTRIRIASLRQLDSLLGSLDLLVVPIDPASSDRGQSLSALVAEIRSELSGSPSGSSEFESKLLLAGYTEDDDASRRTYAIGIARRYEVNKEFPSLIPASVPHGVVEASYTIDLGACKPFERPFPL